MDGTHFDAMTRGMATGMSRRRVLRGLLSGLSGAAAALLSGRTEARPRCRDTRSICLSHSNCCSGFCAGKDRTGRRRCAACSNFVCGDFCCPPETVGCSFFEVPGQPVKISCLCPCETIFDLATNICAPLNSCEFDTDCCSDKCCGGVCCDSGQQCCGGVCSTEESCICPSETACSGSATCTRCDKTYSTKGTCCPHPQAGHCCSDSAPGAGDGFAECCIPGVDCRECPVGSQESLGGVTGVCCFSAPGTCDNKDEDCCLETFPGGDANGAAPCCEPDGQSCNSESDPPCCGTCVDGTCVCRKEGESCEISCCGTLYCDPERKICRQF